MFSFHPSVRSVSLEVSMQGYSIPHFPSLMMAMAKPAYLAIAETQQSTLFFVPSRKQSKLTCLELIEYADQSLLNYGMEEVSL